MIQAPQLQYVPTQQPVQTGYQQQGAYNPVQYQNATMPGAIYNYPAASSYMPAQTATMGHPQYNGVNIEILNPQGMAGCGMPQQPVMPATFYPVPQQVMIPQAPAQIPAAPQVPVMPAQIPAVPQAPAQQIPAAPAQQPTVPAPQVQQPNAAAPVIAEPTTETKANVNPESFAGRLKTNDTDAQKGVIEELAKYVKYRPETENKKPEELTQEEKDNLANGPVLLDTQIFDSLVDIINKDTSSLEGPSPEVLELRQKNPDDLTAEEKAKIAPTPLEKAEINKQYALYTISYMQERLNNELEKRNGNSLELKDLPCIETVIDTAKSNQNPMLRIGAIAALSHIAKPQYNEDLKTIFELAKSDEDERVQEAAKKAAENLAK